MYHAETTKEKLRLFMVILGPILITQLSYFGMNLIDTIMSGRAGTDDLAGVAIGANLWMPVFTAVNGILLAITPIVSQQLGAGEGKRIAGTITQGLYLGVLFGVLVITLGAAALSPALSFMSLEPGVERIAAHYLIGLAFGIIPFFLSIVLRNFFDAQGHTRITMVIMLGTLPFNAFFNYVLIFGKFGFPELGGIGAGYATAISYWIIFAFSVMMTFRIPAMRRFRIFLDWYRPSWQAWKEQLRIGVPMGMSLFFESSIFSAVSLLMASLFSTVTVAAHQVALSFTSLIFMVPLSISIALTIVVAFEVGGGYLEGAKAYTRLGVASAMGILGVASIGIFLLREPIAYIYTTNEEVVQLAAQFFLFAIVYQISDAAQASLQGVLRGYKDVTVPFFTALVSYWALGLPAGYLLAVTTPLGPFGLWLGITVGLTSAAIGFFIRLKIVVKRHERGFNVS